MAKPKRALNILVSTEEEVVWRGEATSVSSENSQGEFDVLPQHANFVTIVRGKPIRIRQGKDIVEELTFETAVLHTQEDKVRVYVIEPPPKNE